MSGEKKIAKKKPAFSPKKFLKFCGVMLVFIYAAVVLIKQQITLSQLEYLKEEKSRSIATVTLENQALQDEYKKASTEEYLEQAIRENLGYVKPNERVFVDISQEH